MAKEFESVTASEFLAPDQLPPEKKRRFRPLYVVLAISVSFVCLVLYFLLNAKAVLFKANPEYAVIDINDGFSFPIGNSRLLLRGQYSVDVNAEGFYPISDELLINGETAPEISYQMKPLPGNLKISLSGSEEIIGSAQISGNTLTESLSIDAPNELLFENLDAGIYQLHVDANLYAEKDVEIDVPGKNQTHELSIELEPNWGWVQYETNPEPANIFVENQQIIADQSNSSENPNLVRTRFEAGEYQVTLSLDDYKPVIRDINVALDQEVDLGSITLEHVDSKISVNTDPAGVSVVVNDNYAGETPLILDLLPDQVHQLNLFKAGFQSRTETIEVERNSEVALEYALKPDLVQVSLSLYPENASLTIAGKSVTERDGQISLAAIKHLVEVSAPGYETQKLDFLPIRGTRQHLQVRLLTEQQALWANIPPSYTTKVGQEMKLFRDAGLVEMGSSRRETGRRANEAPWTAELERPFYVGVKEVTNRQYKIYEPEHSSGNFQGTSLDRADQPVIGISWQQAALYCNWLSEQEGLAPFYTTERGFVSGHDAASTGYRLLTEAEWSWVTKMNAAGFRKKYMWGDAEEIPGPIENYADQSVADLINFTIDPINDSYIASAPVGSFAPNEKGVFDLSGNVTEWMHDWYDTAPYKTGEAVIDPLGPEQGEFHVIRGASWARGYQPQLRLAYRDYDSTGRNDLGFRVAKYAM